MRTAFGAGASHLLVRDAATEAAVKAQPLGDYRVLHLAAHGTFRSDAPLFSSLRLADGNPVNHPANIGAVYAGLAKVRGVSHDALEAQVETNFHRLFG